MSIALNPEQVDALKQRLASETLCAEDKTALTELIDLVVDLRNQLIEKILTIARLQQIFQVKTEKRPPKEETPKKPTNSDQNESPKKGHGKRAANDYAGATRIFHPISDHHMGDCCPLCQRGHLRNHKNGLFLSIDATQPFDPTVHEKEKLICDTCGQIFTAKLPDDIKEERFTPSARALLGLMKYGYGFPFHRQGALQNCLGVPIPPSTQWDEVERLADCLLPVHRQFEILAANGNLIHVDDTPMKIMHLEIADNERKAVFTTGVISYHEGHPICMFYTTNRHAGENLDLLLNKRRSDLPPPILMSDALSRNKPKNHPVDWFNCLTHARRKFVEIESAFPEEAGFIMEALQPVYFNEKQAVLNHMDPKTRRWFHQQNSGQHMDTIHTWCESQLAEKRVEPNSSLGKAIEYMLNHWPELTGFLRIEGVPLTNDILERLLKTAILNRKNAMFYKTQAGAWVGDLLMAMIRTSVMARANPLHYLTFLQENQDAARQNPERFMPWNYLRDQPEVPLKSLNPEQYPVAITH